MGTVLLDRHTPVLEPALSALTYLVREGSVQLQVPRNPTALGLAVDIEQVLSRLYRGYDLFLKVGGESQLEIIRGEEEKELPAYRKRLSIEVGDSFQYIGRTNRRYGGPAGLHSGGKNIRVFGHRNDRLREGSQLMERLSSSLPPTIYKTRLLFKSDETIGTGFPISLPFQDFPPLSGGPYAPYYPVTGNRDIKLEPAVFETVSLPVRLHDMGEFMGFAIDIMSKGTTTEILSSRFHTPKERIEKALEESTPLALLFIECFVQGGDYGRLLERLGCPKGYEGIILRTPLGALHNSTGPRMERIAEEFNRSAQPGTQGITVEQLRAVQSG